MYHENDLIGPNRKLLGPNLRAAKKELRGMPS